MNTWFISDTHFGHFNVIEYSTRPFLAHQQGSKIIAGNNQYPIDLNKKLEDQIKNHSVEWMNNTLINNWNNFINPEDLVYFVGDFAFLNLLEMKAVIDQLHGRKILIKGNHDRSKKQMLSIGFEEVHDELTIKIMGEDVLMSHYPYVDLDFYNIASKRPNMISFTNNPKMKNIPLPEKMEFEESKELLLKIMQRPINSTEEGAKEYIVKIQRLLSKHVGSRALNKGMILLHGHTHSTEKRFANMINCSVEAWDYKPASLADIEKLIMDYKKETDLSMIDQSVINNPVYSYYSKLSGNILENKKFYDLKNMIGASVDFKRSIEKNELFKTRHIPKDYSQEWYKFNVDHNGFVPMDKLKHGSFYEGHCRNASWAYWNGDKKVFSYIRAKFGSSFIEDINPIEKDNGFDLFVPFKETDLDSETLKLFWDLKRD